MALAQLFSGIKLNKLFVRILEEYQITVVAFFQLDASAWRSQYQLAEDDIVKLQQTKAELPNYSFLAEDYFAQGYEIVLLNSPEYSPTLHKNLANKGLPIILYIKGNKQLLQMDSIAIVGSRNPSEQALQFTDNITKRAAKDGKVVISGYAKGIDRQALDSTINNQGKSIIVLPQGIMTFGAGFKQYYKQIIAGDILVLSTFYPKAPWDKAFAMQRNAIIYGLAKEIYVAEANETGGTWSGVMDGLRKGRHNEIYVRKSDSAEKNANLILIEQYGARPVNINGEVLEVLESLEMKIMKVIKEAKQPLVAKEIIEKTGLNWSVRKMIGFLKKQPNVEIVKKTPLQFRIGSEQTIQQDLPFL
ncbi:MAG: DNA-processing protein DprA [bacterium]|nr:DNA-processing protein DprA [bacterium]